MKTNRYILSLLLLVVSVFNLAPAHAQQNQYAIYNYRNDGDFNAWLNIDVDSITYSCIDTLGVEHEDVVVQEVWTPDTLYRIPISAIDSIGFRAPETVMKSDVFIIREIHVPYTLDVDSLSLLFDSSIPASMLPSIGQVVVSETFDGPYEEGFVGRVVKINNLGNSIEIICEDATLFDIYDQLIAVGKFESVEETSQNGKKQLPKRILGFDDIDKSGEYTFEIGKLKLKHDKFEWVSAEYTPEIKFEYILYIHKDDPIHVKFLISGKHDFALNVDYKVLEKLSTESKDEIWICDVPLPYFYGFKPIFKVGLFYKVGGKAHVTGKIPVTISHGLGFEYHGSGLDISNVNILKSFDMDFGEPELDLKIDGYVAGGLCADLGVKFLHKKLASIEAILKMGPKLTTSFDLSANDIVNDPSAYSILKNTKLKADFDIGIDAKYRILKKQSRILPRKGWPGVENVNQYEKEEDWPKGEISWSWNLFECYILPEFTHSFSSYNNQQAVFSTTASRELFFPVKIGAQIEKNGIIETVMQPNSYWSEYFDAKTRTFDTQFDDIALGNTYTSKPVVEILGCRLTASPAATIDTDIKQLSLKEGTKDTITIGDGKTTFAVRSDNPKIATCSIDKKDKSKMIVNAIKQGVATIILTDTKKNESSMLQVTVVDKNTTDLTLSVTELDLNTESSASVLITSGSGNYTVESSNSEVATAECTDNTILVTAHTVGTATITVTDTESGFTATIDVTVTEEATDDLTLSETTVSMEPNGKAEVTITSGSGSYTLENSDEEVAVAAISNGNKVAIAARKAGTATITVTDTKTQQTATIAVTVTDGGDEGPIDGEVTTEQYEAAKETIKQSGWYKIFTRYNGTNLGTKKYYLKSDGYLTEDESEAKVFRFSQVTGSNLFVSPGWKLNVPFTNPELTNGSTGALLPKGHILTNSKSRDDWEGQVWYKNGERYAVRATNATSNTWGANTYWTALDSNSDGLPEADYSLTPKFVWQLEQSLTLTASSIFILNGDTETIEITSGSGNYRLSNSDASVVAAALNNGNEIRLTAKKADKAFITVTDTEIGTSTTISVVVINDTPIVSETFTVNGVSFNMVGIKGGAFWMGAADDDKDAYSLEKPSHLVTVSSFAIGQTEVTQELWEAVMGSNPSTHKGEKFPVEYISWNDCQEFIAKLNQLTGRNFRMPTEAEWEYAARGGKRSKGFKYAGSDNIDEVAWNYSNSGRQPHNVATKLPNELGLYDMSGNVFEWTQDWYSDYVERSQLNPSGPSSGTKKVDRGGSYLGTARDSRITDRIGPQSTTYRYEVGLRIVLGDGINQNDDNISTAGEV